MKPHLLLAGAILCVHSFAADPNPKTSEAAERDAKHRREKITAELKRLPDHPWAGEYYAGDGLGVNTHLSIAPDSGFVFEWHGCLGLYDRNYGAVDWTNNHLRLSFKFENKQKGFQGLAPDLLPVPWGSLTHSIETRILVQT